MQSKSHIESVKKYNKANYKQLKLNVKPEVYEMIENYTERKGISKAAFIVAACKYCIENNIDLKTDKNRE